MSYKIDDNIKLIKDKPEELEKYYKDLTEILDQQGNIRFCKSNKISSFKKLIIEFYYEKKTTYFLDNNIQCLASKRRSFIDFYLLQKYYLEEPISFKDCIVIYLDLTRLTGKYIITHAFALPEYLYYYCSTVKKNVFVEITKPTEEEFEFLDKYDFKIKENEIQTEKELS